MPVYRNIRAIKLPITGDMIAKKTLYADHLAVNAIAFSCPTLQIGRSAGLSADSTGVKARSPRYWFRASGVKSLTLGAKISSIPSDAVVRVGVIDVDLNEWIVWHDFEGSTGEYFLTSYTVPGDDHTVELRAEVTTASATSGATFDLDYAVMIIDFGFS